MSSVGGIQANTLSWTKVVPFAHSTRWRQTGRNGNGHTVGPVYADPSKIVTHHFLNSKANEEAFLKSCASLCSGPVTVVESTQQGSDLTFDEVYVEAVVPTKSNGVSGPGSTTYLVVLEWTVYLPHDW
jgi:hypothetical protein